MTNRAELSVMGAAVVALVVAACGKGGAAQSDTGTAEQGAQVAQERVVNVEALEVGTEPFDVALVVTGEVRPDRDVTVSSEESGVIRELLVDRGSRVAAGQSIARIDDRVLRAQHEQARAEADLARETWQRQKRLWEQDQIGTELSYLQARYAAERTEANARMLEARLERTVVSAPVAGTIEDRFVEVGSMVAPGVPVARIIDADPLKVEAGVPERYAGEIRTGGPAFVSFESDALGEVAGRLDFVGGAVEEQSRTFPVEVRIPNPGGRLKPGLVARVRLSRGSLEQAVLVPRDAVLRSENGYVVYVVVEEAGRTVAHARPVTTGAGSVRRTVITDGLEPGDRVIIVGQQQVAHGDIVRVTNTVGGER